MWHWLRGLLGLRSPEPPAEPAVARRGYWPTYSGGHTVETVTLGPYQCELVTDMQPAPDLLGPIRYAHLLLVRDGIGLCLVVAAEANTLRAVLGGGSHWFCVYPGEGCDRIADGDEFADLARFRTAALAQVRRHLQLGDDLTGA